jgi:hypothetical protein
MNLHFDFHKEEFISLCTQNLHREKTTVSQDIHDAFVKFTDIAFSSYPEIQEVKHFGTGDDGRYLSLQEYIDSLDGMIFFNNRIDVYVKKTAELSIEGVILPDFLELIPAYYGCDNCLEVRISAGKARTSINLIKLRVDKSILKEIFIQFNDINILLPSRLDVGEWRQTFYNKITGDVFFCDCFKNVIEKLGHHERTRHQHVRKALTNTQYKKSICHLCRNEPSDLFYCHPMYGSVLKVKYGAYIKKASLELDIEEREAENLIREKLGVPKIGEKWINETMLYKYIVMLFPDYEVQREASPEWLEGQRFDIYIPALALAIEYQGEQHFKPVNLFGGEKGFEKTKARDKIKLEKCRKNGVSLVYFSYKDNLTEKFISKKLAKYLSDAE